MTRAAPRDIRVISSITDEAAASVWPRLLPGTPPPAIPTASALADALAESGTTATDVVVLLAADSGPHVLETVSALLPRPAYVCAQGETGRVLTDDAGRPLPTPRGHRWGEPTAEPASPPPTRHPRRGPRSDPRRIVAVAPNPKMPGSRSRAIYDLYRVGDTLDEARAAGVPRAHVLADVAAGHVRVEP